AAGASAGSAPVPLSGRVLLLAFALCYAALRLVFRFRAKAAGRTLVPVSAALLGRQAHFTALLDTGSSLLDPLSGERVLVACPHALRPIFREHTELFDALPPVELLEAAARIPELRGRLRLLPYSALGGSGLLPVFRPDSLTVEGRPRRDVLVAVSPRASGEDFEAVL
ncbi:MAG: sigma-E processing peptidase SpoIIGA, partial [Oscillospiraceae bacterium]|nr:sigma-E processing peptidase SpoIIGA [Oscillospiraceae bacterium]